MRRGSIPSRELSKNSSNRGDKLRYRNRALGLLLCLAAVSCTEAQASRTRRANGARSRGSATGTRDLCTDYLTDGLSGWLYRYDGTSASTSAWVDLEGNVDDLSRVTETGSVTVDSPTTNIEFCDSTYVDKYVHSVDHTYYRTESDGHEAVADGQDLHTRLLFNPVELVSNDVFFISWRQTSGSDGWFLQVVSSSAMKFAVYAGGSANECQFSISADSDYLLDFLYDDTGASAATLTIWLNGVETSCNTTETTTGMDAATRFSIFSSSTNNETENAKVLFLGTRNDDGEITKSRHDRDCEALGLCE